MHQSFNGNLIEWFRNHARDLPWRRDRSVYKTVVSEFMLQQTQIRTALPYFERWLATFPDFAALADAEEDKVLHLWQGLGYYSRARNLHRLARAWMNAVSKPVTMQEWLTMPGVGPYTAAAIASQAFSEPVAAIDGNVIRVLSRVLSDHTEFRDATRAREHLEPFATSLLPSTDPGSHNEALMELGATVCHVQKPQCTRCPVLSFCTAGKRGDPERFPRRFRRPTTSRIQHKAWVRDIGCILLQRTPDNARRLAGFLSLPDSSLFVSSPPGESIILQRTRTISNERITEVIYRFDATRELYDMVAADPFLVWLPLDKLPCAVLSGPHRRWIEELLRREEDHCELVS